MLFNKTIDLVTITYVKDELGQQKPNTAQEIIDTVYTDQKSVSASEVFGAGQIKVKPSCIFVIRACDYNYQTIVRFENVRYSVYRTFLAKNEMIELYCEVK